METTVTAVDNISQVNHDISIDKMNTSLAAHTKKKGNIAHPELMIKVSQMNRNRIHILTNKAQV